MADHFLSQDSKADDDFFRGGSVSQGPSTAFDEGLASQDASRLVFIDPHSQQATGGFDEVDDDGIMSQGEGFEDFGLSKPSTRTNTVPDGHPNLPLQGPSDAFGFIEETPFEEEDKVVQVPEHACSFVQSICSLSCEVTYHFDA